MIDFTGMPMIEANMPLQQALKRINKAPLEEILSAVAASIPSTVPEVEKDGWKHGAMHVSGRINGWDSWSIENGMAPSNALDLADITYVGFYRQAVINKYTGEPEFFVAVVPLGFSGEVKPGQTVEVQKSIPFDWKTEDVEAMARESFLKLQELVVEYYNREIDHG
jgi:hypothetical protein